MGIGPLSHQEIGWWAYLMRIRPRISPSEVDILRKLDRICRTYHFEKNNPQERGSLSLADLKEIADTHRAERDGKAKNIVKNKAKT